MSKDVHSHLFTPRGSGRPLRLARARLLGVGLVALGLLVVAAPRAGPIAAGGTERSRALPDAPRASRPDAGLSAALRKLEPGEDGWNSEAFQEVAEARLRRMGELAGRRQRVDAAAVRGIVGPGFACDPLRPALLRTVYSSESIEAHVLDASERRRRAPPAQHRGAEGLARALMELISPFDASSRIAVDVKMFRVDLRGTTVDTSVLVHAYGPAKQGSLEQHSTWRVQWVWGSPDVDPVLVHIGVESFEEITSRQGSLFHDGTQTILGADQGFREQVARSTDYWLERLERWIERDFEGYYGLALGDVNGDGLDDLYLPQMTGLPNRLYVRRPDGTLRDRSAASGVDWLDRTRSALILDLDNDGDEDLVVGARSAVLFMDNDGQGRFAVRSAVAMNSDTLSMAAADYDADGDLDIYACAYWASQHTFGEIATPIPYHDANDGGANTLLANDGRWGFTDVTARVGLDANNHRWSFAASWEDFDNDGDPDLYVANDFGRNNLYRNEGGTFVDITASAGVEDMAAGMSATWGDYDQDGWMDIYVSNMFSSAGTRVTAQKAFKPDVPSATKARYQRHARGNSLLHNVGDGTFRDVSVQAGVTRAGWAWGSKFIDFDNDGREDLLVANGYLTREDTGDL